MIIDNPMLQAIALGSGRVIPQEGDAQVQLPAMLFPSIDVMQPTETYQSTNTGSQGSNLTSIAFNRINQAGAQSNMQLLPKGLYDVECFLSTVTDVVAAGAATVAATINYVIGGSSVSGVFIHHWQSLNPQTTFGRFRVLAMSDIQFRVNVGVAAVAQNLAIFASINAVRIL